MAAAIAYPEKCVVRNSRGDWMGSSPVGKSLALRVTKPGLDPVNPGKPGTVTYLGPCHLTRPLPGGRFWPCRGSHGWSFRAVRIT